MKTVRQACQPRDEVLRSDLEDALFAAKFGHVVANEGAAVYRDAETFFRNTHPATTLKKVVQTVFERLANPDEAGAAIRLSTGFGGGKTHSLISLWHLARNIGQTSLGTELLPAAGRPKEVAVAGLDASEYGAQVVNAHEGLQTHSLWGELAFQLGGAELYRRVEAYDDPHNLPPATVVRSLLPDRPTLILFDELVIYMAQLDDPAEKAVLAFLGMLISGVTARRQAVVVVTDTAGQPVYESEASKLRQLEAAGHLDDFLGRSASDYDPIGNETPQVIARRLFAKVDRSTADEVSAAYYSLYQRMASEHPGALPSEAATKAYADEFVRCYPFHPRLLMTAQDRLGAIQDFNRSRGTLRLFARILRDVWEGEQELYLISAGDINWASSRIQADLLSRLNRDNFRAAVNADVLGHAVQLDAEFNTDVHQRVASALLLESLPLSSTGMRHSEVTLAVLRPSDAGHEPGEALNRLIANCWHTYADASGERYEFRYEPNANKIIEERAGTIPYDDALQGVLTIAQNYFTGHVFALAAFPASPKAVQDAPGIQLALCDSEELARRVCDYRDDSDPDNPIPRRFRNAILAIAPVGGMLDDAVQTVRRLRAADQVKEEERRKLSGRQSTTPLLEQVDKLISQYNRRARQQTLRAYTRVYLSGRAPTSLSEKYLVSEEGALLETNGQAKLKEFLDDKGWVYQPGDSLDVHLLATHLLPGATPSVEHQGAHPASAILERALSSDRLKLFMDGQPVRAAILKGVEQGLLAVRLPSGEAYDAEGMVAGPPGARYRVAGQRLPGLSLTSDVLVALVEAPCVQEWLQVTPPPSDDAGDKELLSVAEAAALKATKTGTVEDALDIGHLDAAFEGDQRLVVNNERFRAWVAPRPPDADSQSVSAVSWEEALAHAAERPLLALRLSTTNPNLVNKLIAAAAPLGASRLALTVRVSGSLKEGGTVQFLLEGASYSGSLKPIDQALTLFRACAEDDRYLEAILALSFANGGLRQAGPCLEQARQNADVSILVRAEFGHKPEGTGS